MKANKTLGLKLYRIEYMGYHGEAHRWRCFGACGMLGKNLEHIKYKILEHRLDEVRMNWAEYPMHDTRVIYWGPNEEFRTKDFGPESHLIIFDARAYEPGRDWAARGYKWYCRISEILKPSKINKLFMYPDDEFGFGLYSSSKSINLVKGEFRLRKR